MSRYLRLFAVQLRASLLLGLQYRADFLIDGIISVFWALTAVIPLFVVFQDRTRVAGWTFGESVIVVGWFTLLEGILEGGINPSLANVVEHIRQGTLDFILLKPADAQFLVSTARFELWRVTNAFTALAMFGYGLSKVGHMPTVGGILSAGVLLCASTLVLYSLWIITVSAAFYVVRVDNLTFLFNAIFDAARWPVSVFRGVIRFVFTFVVPLAVMTTFPAEALLGRLPGRVVGFSVLGAIGFAGVARWVWLRSIARYTSASS